MINQWPRQTSAERSKLPNFRLQPNSTTENWLLQTFLLRHYRGPVTFVRQIVQWPRNFTIEQSHQQMSQSQPNYLPEWTALLRVQSQLRLLPKIVDQPVNQLQSLPSPGSSVQHWTLWQPFGQTGQTLQRNYQWRSQTVLVCFYLPLDQLRLRLLFEISVHSHVR